ncbi:MAG: hypothetical protein QOE45_1578 [Frankiaceae bacterium]|nr:hypothetical protein [Frankiaceae bacterium]
MTTPAQPAYAAAAAPGTGHVVLLPALEPAPTRRAGLLGAGRRLAYVAAGTVFLGLLRIHRPPALATVCLLRSTTGIPCPLCGGTTAFTRLGRGRVAAAFAANPFALLLVAAVVLAPTGVFRPVGRAPQRTVWALFAGVLALSWGWQLRRFGYL